ncbi:hypothetical protein QA596_10140 [Balneolales bacterium ANBcel1]|nr:hypothetical protein [Balneolales bacterium ANBcel1]
MKNNRNKSIAMTAILLLSFFFVTYCTHDMGDKGVIQKPDETLEQYRVVGMLHNEVMADVLADLQGNTEPFEDRSSAIRFMEESLTNSIASKELMHNMDKGDIRKIVAGELINAQSDDHLGNVNKAGHVMDRLSASAVENLTEQQWDILEEVDRIIETSENGEEMISALERINSSDAVQKLDPEQRYVIYAATSVGIESAEYWEQHYEEWVKALVGSDYAEYHKSLNADFFDEIQWFNGRSMVRADVGGAVGGAVAGCMGGAVVGGIGCGPGAAAGALGTSAGASATNAAKQLFDRIFDNGGS